MWLQTKAIRVVISALLLCIVTGCAGYQFAAKDKGIFLSPEATVRIKGVENPTLMPRLTPIVRNLLRDEISRRNMATWVDSGQADYLIHIDIAEATNRSYQRDSNEETLIYSAQITLEVTIYDGKTNSVIWRSGRESMSRTFNANAQTEALNDATTLLIRSIVDKMHHTF